MNQIDSILASAKRTIGLERDAISHLEELLDGDFVKTVELIYQNKGRVVISGIGKSAIIASKIVATMNSTGTPAIFMHAADAIHGDLGSIQKDDVVILISKSGNTPEIKALVPLIKKGGYPLVGMTGNPESFLGTQADLCLNTYIEKEACPNNLAPTTSTTAQLVMGDALAICLLELKEFGSEDFAKYHPGGALGKKLYLTVGDIARNNQVPQVAPDTDIREVIVEISERMLGATAVLDQNEVVGIITDGDIRRMLKKHTEIGSLTAQDIMTAQPKTMDVGSLAVKALETMQDNGISQLLAVDGTDYVGVVHIHNLINEGIL